MYYTKNQSFKLRIIIETTGERYVVKDANKSLLVRDLKEKIEAQAGIPSFLLLLFYLDECPLTDSKPLSYFHVLPDGKIKVRVWKTHETLINAARVGIHEVVEKQLHPKTTCASAAHDPERMLIALFISCFHGNCDIVEQLLKLGVNYRKPLPSGRDAILVAAVRGNIRCVELLLHRKVRPHEWNFERMSLTNWELQDRIKTTLDRIEKTKTSQNLLDSSRLTYSQTYDSAFSTWYTGEHAQLYLCQILQGVKQKPKKDQRPVFRP